MPSEPPRTLELYVRSLTSRDANTQQEATIERIAALADRGCVDEWTVYVWGRQLCPTNTAAATDTGRHYLDRLGSFFEWASEHGRSLAPGFEIHVVDIALTDDRYHAIRLPAMTLAEFVDDELRFVAPCMADGTVHTVPDRLDAIERAAADDRRAVTGDSDPL